MLLILYFKCTYFLHASNYLPKYIEIETINLKSINNFKCALSKSDVYDMLDQSSNADPDSNYDILAIILANAKVKHLPKKTKNVKRG